MLESAKAMRRLEARLEPVPTFEDELSIQEAEHDAHLLAATEQYEINGCLCVDDDETTPWLKYTQWPVRLHDRPLDILSATALQPASSNDDYVLGYWRNTPFVSSGSDETKLRLLMVAVDQMCDRAEATLYQTHHRLLCWLQTTHERHFRPWPFQSLQRRASRTRYISVWKHFLCYVFRVWATAADLRQEIYGLQFGKAEANQLEYIWSILLETDQLKDGQADLSTNQSDIDSDSEQNQEDFSGSDNGSESESESTRDGTWSPQSSAASYHSTPDREKQQATQLTEAVFQLSMMFWTFRSTTGDLSTSVLIHFTGILGIHRRALSYKSAYIYTPTLSALVWIGRLLFLEYALPVTTYATLATPWPSREAYTDQTQRLEQIRVKYLLRGGFHPMGEIIEMRAFGKQLVKKEGARANLAWASDGRSFSVNDRTVQLMDVVSLYRIAIEAVQTRVRQAMFHWQPEIDLHAVTDNLTRQTAGWSFLNETSNGLQLAYKALTRRAWTLPALGLARNGRWVSVSCLRYVESLQRLLDDIFTAIHVTAGLPARGPEITTIKTSNTAQVLRSIFVLNGRFFIVFEYNKTRRTTNQSFYVVRYLPPKLGVLLYQYLVYVRPFADFLCRQLGFPHLHSSEFLFPDPKRRGKHLGSPQATQILRQATQHFPTPMTLALYRQTSLTIAKRYIPKLIQQKNFYKPKDTSDPYNMIAMGTGHHTRALLTAYAIDRAYPTRLQPELLELYLRLSTLWQAWNEQYDQDHRPPPSDQGSATAAGPSRKRQLGEAEASTPWVPEKPYISSSETGQPSYNRTTAFSPAQSTAPPGSCPVDFRYDPDHKILICRLCESAMQPGPKSWYRHLNHHRILGSACTTLMEQFSQHELLPTEQLVTPTNVVRPVTGLRVFPGFTCKMCPGFRTVRESKIRDHMGAVHRVKPLRARNTGQYQRCLLQTFFSAKGKINYFEVLREGNDYISRATAC